MIIAFELEMPGRASWDGKWSGDERTFIVTRSVKSQRDDVLGSHYYRWSDGWCACVTARQVDGRTAAKLRRKSSGFSGYDWMIDSILARGKILADHEIEAVKEQG